ncbi:hypothetical protein [Streptomyces antibioticus]|uniref:hypothetical protein n=1 Tax=Streptomyces antibioticus TaxID=1890 RepID=UPI003F46812B
MVSDDPETLALLAAELDVSIESLVESNDLQSALNPVIKDAQVFGTYARQGGWMFGLLVARSVKREGALGFGEEGRNVEQGIDIKLSAKQFALRAGTSAARVTRFYRAWERAAEAGVVPRASELHPGQAIELPDAELWAEYFTIYEKNTERRESIAQQADAAGTSYSQAMKVAENPSALRTAILGDTKTAEAARKALFDRSEEDDDLRLSLARSIASDAQMKKHLTSESRKNERSEFIRNVAREGKAKTPAGQTVELPEDFKAKVHDQLAAAEAPGADADAVSTAYEAVRELISQVVESDPEVQASEQRSRVTKALASTARSIESIDPEVLASLADESVRETLIDLQRKVNELAELLGSRKGAALRAV